MGATAFDTSIEQGRSAARRRAWAEAYEAFAAAGDPSRLEPEDLNLLANAAWWTGHPNESISAHERAYAAQGALLRVVQEREVVPVGRAAAQRVDVRFVATSPYQMSRALCVLTLPIGG